MATKLVSDEVYEALYTKIVDGEWQVDSKIPSESQICKATSASRISVRTALHKLQAQNLIVTYPGRGSFVTNNTLEDNSYQGIDISADDYRYMVELRRSLEFESIELFCLYGEEKDYMELEAACRQMNESKDLEGYISADIRFHYAIVSGAHNPIFKRIYDSLRPEFEKYFTELSKNNEGGNREKAKSNHRRILDFIRNKKPKEAIALIENTFEYNYNRLTGRFKA
ncbi:MAG: FadR family transcriptional regulator [Spirochaetales bacterium]|nr:FadR family transcriptional regulator [Spirochaetales bacterium]